MVTGGQVTGMLKVVSNDETIQSLEQKTFKLGLILFPPWWVKISPHPPITEEVKKWDYVLPWKASLQSP